MFQLVLVNVKRRVPPTAKLILRSDSRWVDYAWALLSVKSITMALGSWRGSEHMLVSSVVPPGGFSEALLSPQTFFLFMMGRTALSWTLFLCLFLRSRLIHFLAWCCWVFLQTLRASDGYHRAIVESRTQTVFLRGSFICLFFSP